MGSTNYSITDFNIQFWSWQQIPDFANVNFTETTSDIQIKLQDVNDKTISDWQNMTASLMVAPNKEYILQMSHKKIISSSPIKTPNRMQLTDFAISFVKTDIETIDTTSVTNTPPIIIVLEPILMETIDSVLIVKLKVEDDKGVSLVTVNDSVATPLPNDEFEAKISLKVGENQIVTIAVDSDTLSTEETLSVYRHPESVIAAVDTITINDPPKITIIEPTKIKTTDSTLIVKLKVEDDKIISQVTVNDVFADALPNGNFQTEIPLQIGINLIEIRATNIDSASSDTMLSIIREKDIEIFVDQLEFIKKQLINGEFDPNLLTKFIDGELTYRNLLTELVECNETCGDILSSMAAVYLSSTKDAFRGIVFFNFGSEQLEPILQGDKSHGGIVLDNERQLRKVLEEWKQHEDWEISLDARASLIGRNEKNDSISEDRAYAVMRWFVEHNVPYSRINFKWLGEYGPLLDQNVCALYGLSSLYDEYERRDATQTKHPDKDGRFYYDGLNQSVAIFLYEPK